LILSREKIFPTGRDNEPKSNIGETQQVRDWAVSYCD
jgi:hypothetical protein